MSRKTKKPSHRPFKENAAPVASARVVMLAMYDYDLAEDNGKHGLVGVFDTLGARQFPARFRFYLFVKATAAPGHHAAKIELREKANNKLIPPTTPGKISPGLKISTVIPSIARLNNI